jgi:lysophospholipase L1-like esterase
VTGLSRAAVLAALPVLLTQGRALKRDTPRLPDAHGLSGQVGTGTPSHSVLLVGDSVATGVGVDHQENCLAGRLAFRLAEPTDSTVGWSVLARSGATASGVRRLVDTAGPLGDPDLVVLSVGVNDVKVLTSDRVWVRELAALLDGLARHAPRADLVWIGVPPMHQFPMLPAKLARLAGGRAARLDALGTLVLATRPRVRRVALDIDMLEHGFGEDGFHPSAAGHDRIAEEILRG